MSSSNLAAKYRPQTFAQVAGQEAVRAILSRASAEDRIAPAYLFSGTRGVGKTTIARILAKALNCKSAPTGEPCNECSSCRQIARGSAVDVVEIDAASNRGIDEARRLKEDVGYAPIEGRYKVFIIDEAHMLTREAFNALLKTLEEPPSRVTFILATTEPHKFPATIISRCQHYVFKRLPQADLEAHLSKVLGAEAIDFEPSAVSLIARRGAGSVRDSMSLLGQALALGREKLLEVEVRRILGLAGQEVFFEVMEAVAAQDVAAIAAVLEGILDQGLDLGFFLRELGACWRNLFLLRQAGEKALPLLGLPEEEARRWLDFAPRLGLPHIHACWQMTLEGQRGVLKSLEPAMALELLLLNLAFLPSLVSLEDVGKAGAAPARPAGGQGGPAGSGGPGGPGRSIPPRPGSMPPRPGGSFGPGPARAGAPGGPAAYGSRTASDRTPPAQAPSARAPWEPLEPAEPGGSARPAPAARPDRDAGPSGVAEPPYGADSSYSGSARSAASSPVFSEDASGVSYTACAGLDEYGQPGAPASPEPRGPASQARPAPRMPRAVEPGTSATQEFPARPGGPGAHDGAPTMPRGPRDWSGFVHFFEQRCKAAGVPTLGMRHARGEMDGETLVVHCMSDAHCRQIFGGENAERLRQAVRDYFGPQTDVEVRSACAATPTRKELRGEIERDPVVRGLIQEFDGQLLEAEPVRNGYDGPNGEIIQ